MPRGRVLVVEDEVLIRLMLTETLEEAGYAVTAATSADEAAGVLMEHDGFVALVTDIHMPGLRDGLALGRLARERDPGLPVIYVTGRPDAMRAAGSLGPSEMFLPKPYLPSQVVSALRRLTGPG